MLSPEMKSTGEVMGIDDSFGKAFLKSQFAAGMDLPSSGNILITLREKDRVKIVEPVRKLHSIGFNIVATKGTAQFFGENGIPCKPIYKLNEGRPDIIDEIKNGHIDLIFNVPVGEQALIDDAYIRKTATQFRIPLVTTVPGVYAMAEALASLKKEKIGVKPLQEYFK